MEKSLSLALARSRYRFSPFASLLMYPFSAYLKDIESVRMANTFVWRDGSEMRALLKRKWDSEPSENPLRDCGGILVAKTELPQLVESNMGAKWSGRRWKTRNNFQRIWGARWTPGCRRVSARWLGWKKIFGGMMLVLSKIFAQILFPSGELLLVRFADALHNFIFAINRNNSLAGHAVAGMKL